MKKVPVENSKLKPFDWLGVTIDQLDSDGKIKYRVVVTEAVKDGYYASNNTPEIYLKVIRDDIRGSSTHIYSSDIFFMWKDKRVLIQGEKYVA
jgi:hypothetical protein